MELSERAVALEREERTFTGTFECRDADDGSGLTFDGIASVVDKPYPVRDMLGEYQETIRRGAFADAVKDDDVRLLVNHEGIPLARTSSGTLKLSAKPDLRAVATLDGTSPLVQTLSSAMNRGDLDQMSIGFQAVEQKWNDDYSKRTIHKVKLFDVSAVTFPANPTTTAALRSLDQAVRDLTQDAVNADEIRRAIAYLESLLIDDYQEARESGPSPAPAPIHPDLLAAIYDSAKRARPAVVR